MLHVYVIVLPPALRSVVLAVFLAASDLPGAYSRAHAFMMIMSELTLGVFFLIGFSQARIARMRAHD